MAVGPILSSDRFNTALWFYAGNAGINNYHPLSGIHSVLCCLQCTESKSSEQDYGCLLYHGQSDLNTTVFPLIYLLTYLYVRISLYRLGWS